MTFENGMTIDDYRDFFLAQMEKDLSDKELKEDLANLMYFANRLNNIVEKYGLSN